MAFLLRKLKYSSFLLRTFINEIIWYLKYIISFLFSMCRFLFADILGLLAPFLFYFLLRYRFLLPFFCSSIDFDSLSFVFEISICSEMGQVSSIDLSRSGSWFFADFIFSSWVCPLLEIFVIVLRVFYVRMAREEEVPSFLEIAL